MCACWVFLCFCVTRTRVNRHRARRRRLVRQEAKPLMNSPPRTWRTGGPMNFFEWTTTQQLLGVTFRWEVLVLVFMVFPGPCLSNDDGDGRCSKEEEEPEDVRQLSFALVKCMKLTATCGSIFHWMTFGFGFDMTFKRM